MATTEQHPGDTAVTIADAAERLGVHYMTAYKYVRTGRLDAHKSGTRWLVTVASIDALLGGHDQSDGRAGALRVRGDRRAHLDRLIHALVGGDESTAWATVEAAMESGATADQIDLDLLTPAMHAIGDGWASGELTVADEHRASAVLHRLLGILGSRSRRRGPRRGTVVIGTVAGDPHALPTAVLRGMWARHGFDVIDLGANTPAESMELAARSEGVVAIGLSATTTGNEQAIADTLRHLGDALPGTPRFVGGQAISGAEHATELGADHYDPTGQGALALLDDLAKQTSSSA